MWTHIGEYADQALKEAEVRTEFPDLHGLHTGLPSVDEHLAPALEAGRLIVIAGESGKGKTALAAQLAVAFAHQAPVLWCSLEDGGVDATRRVLANTARVPVSGLRNGFKIGQVPEEAYKAATALEALPLWLVEEGTDVLQVGRAAAAWARQHGGNGPVRGVVIIDQLSHLSPTPWTQEMEDRLAERGAPALPRPRDKEHKVLEFQTAALRYVAEHSGLLVVLLHQLNQVREDDGRPSEASIRSSQGIVHKADAVLIPWRPKKTANYFAGPGDPKTIDAADDAAELIFVKGRAVESGFGVPLKWDGAHQRFAEVENDPSIYVAPEAPTDRAIEGAHRLAEVRARFATRKEVAAPADFPALDSGDAY